MLLIILCFMCIYGCSSNINKVNDDTDIKEKFTNIFRKMIEVIDKISSNHYDYIRNKYYGNIVKLETEIASILEYIHEHNELSGGRE